MNKLLLDTFTFDNVLIKPREVSRVSSRSLVDTTAPLYDVRLELPAISSSMSLFDTTTNRDISLTFAQIMYSVGGLHIFSRGSSLQDRFKAANELPSTGTEFGIAVSYKEFLDNRNILEGLEAFISIDIANGSIIDDITWEGKYPLIVGNFGTPEVTRRDFRGDIIYKLGIGSGSGCTTRLVTGVGAPQGWLIKETASQVSDIPIISDGGVKTPGDFVKALALGADAVMMGRIFASAAETPWLPVKLDDGWYKPYRGMASSKEKRSISHVEGISGYVPYEGKTVKDIMQELDDGLRSAMSYVDAFNLTEFRSNADFLYVPTDTRANLRI